MQNVKTKVFPKRGCIIKDETNIITNIGLISQCEYREACYHARCRIGI